MPVTQKMIGRGMTERPSSSISAPFGEEEIEACRRWVEAYNQTCTFEGRIGPYELFCQNLFAKENLPPWDKWVRIHADGRNWTDDVPEYVLKCEGKWGVPLPEDVHRYFQDLRRLGEDIKSGLNLAYNLVEVDSEVWFACEFFRHLDVVRRARASHAEDAALCRAMDAEAIIVTAGFKFRWEADAIRGKKIPEYGRQGGRVRGPVRRETMEKERANVRKEADILWNELPSLIKNHSETGRELRRRGKTTKPVNTLRKYLSNPEEWCSMKKKSCY
jgi:hypothetical protein